MSPGSAPDDEGPYPARGHDVDRGRCTWRVLQVCGCRPSTKEPEINLIEWRGPRHELPLRRCPRFSPCEIAEQSDVFLAFPPGGATMPSGDRWKPRITYVIRRLRKTAVGFNNETASLRLNVAALKKADCICVSTGGKRFKESVRSFHQPSDSAEMRRINTAGNIFSPLKRVSRTPSSTGDSTKTRLRVHKRGAASAIAKKKQRGKLERRQDERPKIQGSVKCAAKNAFT